MYKGIFFLLKISITDFFRALKALHKVLSLYSLIWGKIRGFTDAESTDLILNLYQE
jgi:hypothetical protein